VEFRGYGLRLSAREGLRFGSKIRVWLDGEEVTDRCFEVEVEPYKPGYVLLYLLDDRGAKYVVKENGESVAAWERREGAVDVEVTW